MAARAGGGVAAAWRGGGLGNLKQSDEGCRPAQTYEKGVAASLQTSGIRFI